MKGSEKQYNKLKAKMFTACPNCGILMAVGKQCKVCKKSKRRLTK